MEVWFQGERRADVVVIGAGLAGLSAALHLRRRSPELRVMVLERGRIAAGAEDSGVLIRGLGPDPVAVARQHGEARLAEAIAFADRSVAILDRLAAGHEAALGFIAVATRRRLTGGDEPVERAVALLRGAGCVATGDGDRLVVDGDRVVESAALLRRLAEAAREAGAEIREDAEVVELAADGDGVRASTRWGSVRAERAVLAAGAWLPGFDAWFSEIAIAARSQLLETGFGAGRAAVAAWSLGPGTAVARRAPDGRVVAAEGCQPMNRGDPFDPAADPAIQARLDQYLLGELAPGATHPAVRRRWARPLLYTCDGLPLVGPHPGRSACVIAAGFCGQDLALAPAAGRAAAEWIVDGRPAECAAWCSPRRML